MKRARKENQDVQEDAQQNASPGPSLSQALEQLPWREALASIQDLFRRFGRLFLYMGLGVGGLIVIRMALDPESSFDLLGTRLAYQSPRTPQAYLAGFQNDATISAERQTGDLYSPVDAMRIGELGTIEMAAGPVRVKKSSSLRVKISSWMVSVKRGDHSDDQVLSPKNASLATVGLQLNKRGMIIQRERSAAVRSDRASVFVAPWFPAARLKPGRTWTETVDWIDPLGDWRIRWTGKRQWKVDGLVPCNDQRCVRLTYDADLVPKIIGSPAWMLNAPLRKPSLTTGHGEVLFDEANHQLFSHTFTSQVTLRIPMSDLARIPEHRRVGRRVFHTPGELVMELQNKVAIQKKSSPSQT